MDFFEYAVEKAAILKSLGQLLIRQNIHD